MDLMLRRPLYPVGQKQHGLRGSLLRQGRIKTEATAPAAANDRRLEQSRVAGPDDAADLWWRLMGSAHSSWMLQDAVALSGHREMWVRESECEPIVMKCWVGPSCITLAFVPLSPVETGTLQEACTQALCT